MSGGLWLPQEADSATIWLPGGVQVGWGVSQVREAFCTSAKIILWLDSDLEFRLQYLANTF